MDNLNHDMFRKKIFKVFRKVQNISSGNYLKIFLLICAAAIQVMIIPPIRANAQDLPYYLQDRGTGIPTSMFGTYIRKGEFLFYPFYEFYYDKDAEYKPSELGYNGDDDYRGKLIGHEALIYAAYGFTDWLMVEMEAAVTKVRQEKSGNDTSDMPEKIEESGLGDVEGQIRWRWYKEQEYMPEFFSYFETVIPTQKDDDVLIGTPDWEFALGVGAIKGFNWGTIMLRTAVAHEREENKTEFGEYAFEYLKKLSDLFRIVLAVEGEQDEVALITELQVHFTENIFLKLNNGWGLTSKATDIAPEVGIMFSF